MSKFLSYSLLILLFLVVIGGFSFYWRVTPKSLVENRSSQLAQVGSGVNTVYIDGQLAADCLAGNYSIQQRDCSGSDGTAYTHPQPAALASSAGQTLLIRGGTYLTHPRSSNGGKNVLWITTTGLPGLPIRFENYNGERVVFDNQRTEGSVIYIDGRNRGDGTSYIEIVGLIITGGAARGDTLPHGIHVRQSRYDLVERNEIYGVEGVGVLFDEQGGIYPEYGHNTIRRNNIHDNYSGLIARGDYTLIEENHIHHNIRATKPGDSDGIGSVGDFSIIRGNVVHNNSDDNIDAPGLGSKPPWYTKGREPENIIIENNVLFQAGHTYDGGPEGDGSGLKSGTHEGGILPSGANIIRYNIAFQNDLRGIEVAGNYRDIERDQLPPPNLYYGNTIFDNGDLDEGGAIDGFYSEDADLILFNNISRNPNNQIFRDVRMRGDPHKVHSDFNNFSDRWIKDWQSTENLLGDGIPENEPRWWDQNSQSSDPLFVNAGNLTVNTDLNSESFGEVSGLRLQDSSPAIDAGVDVRRGLQDLLTEIQSTNKQQVSVVNWTKTITFALANIPNPFPFRGLAPDLGAYESAGGGGYNANQGGEGLGQYFKLNTNSSNGSITKEPDRSTYSRNAQVTLTAVPSSNYRFDKWSGDASGSGNPIVVTMTSDKRITAGFVPTSVGGTASQGTEGKSQGYALTINSLNGSVTREPDFPQYTRNASVRLTALPTSNYRFIGWTGDLSGSDNPVTIVMSRAKTISAGFEIADSGGENNGGGGGGGGGGGSGGDNGGGDGGQSNDGQTADNQANGDSFPQIVGPFAVGMTNDQVRLLQRMLAQDPSVYPEGLITGFYGQLTVLAVQRFQIKYHLATSGSPDTNGFGLAGPATRAKLNDLYAGEAFSGSQENLRQQLISLIERLIAELMSKVNELLQQQRGQ